MKVRILEAKIWVPAPLAEVWRFFSNPENLGRLTPADMGFEMLTPLPIEMKAGARIEHRFRVHGIPIRWRTLILEFEPEKLFVDEQESGPYRGWLHRHEFIERDGGTEVVDRVEYAIPGWIFEPLVHPFIRRDLERVFAFRTERVREIFGSAGEPDSRKGPVTSP